MIFWKRRKGRTETIREVMPLDPLPWSEARLRAISSLGGSEHEKRYEAVRGHLQRAYPSARLLDDPRLMVLSWPFIESLLSSRDALDALYMVDRLNEELQNAQGGAPKTAVKELVRVAMEGFPEYVQLSQTSRIGRGAERMIHTAVHLRALLFFYLDAMATLEGALVSTMRHCDALAEKGKYPPFSACILYEFHRIATRLNISEYDPMYYAHHPMYLDTRGLDALERSYILAARTREAKAVRREIDRRTALVTGARQNGSTSAGASRHGGAS
jgi:hypothetical protein